jgi:hypothetical protein
VNVIRVSLTLRYRDIDGNIRALKEKIKEGVCVELFEQRLNNYLEEKQRRE